MKSSKTSFLRNCISGWNVRVDFYLLAISSSQILSLPLWQEGGVSDISLSQGRGAGSERSEAPLLLSVDARSFRLWL